MRYTLAIFVFITLTFSCKKESNEPNNISKDCPQTTGIANMFIGATSADVTWTTKTQSEQFDIRSRVVGTSNWMEGPAYRDFLTGTVTLGSLTPTTTYEWQVKRHCSNTYSASTVFTTKPYTLQAVYQGSVHTFKIDLVTNPFNVSDTVRGLGIYTSSPYLIYVSGKEEGTNNTLLLRLNGSQSGTYAPTDLTMTVGGNSYTGTNGLANVSLFPLHGFATIAFQANMINDVNFSDMFVLTDGLFSGNYKEYLH